MKFNSKKFFKQNSMEYKLCYVIFQITESLHNLYNILVSANAMDIDNFRNEYPVLIFVMNHQFEFNQLTHVIFSKLTQITTGNNGCACNTSVFILCSLVKG